MSNRSRNHKETPIECGAGNGAPGTPGVGVTGCLAPAREKRPFLCDSLATPRHRIRVSPPCPCLVATRALIALAVAIVIGALLVTPAPAQTETILHSFTATPDGWNPSSRLILDADGNLYGVTIDGGAYTDGTVFELTPQNGAWVETILLSFDIADGSAPIGLITDNAGNFYGAAFPVVYELSPDGQGNWTEAILKNFGSSANTTGGLALDAAGRLYGIAATGSRGASIVYRLSPPAKKAKNKSWKYTKLHLFSHKQDGLVPNADLALDAAGNIYGTTYEGGSYNYGTVYELSPSGHRWIQNVLYNFQGLSDGGYPSGGVILDAAGNLYGTTYSGGTGGGVVYELSPNGGGWTETVLYSFTDLSDGATPEGLLTFHNGNLYGVAEFGGDLNCDRGYGCGAVFELTPSGGGWTENVLYSFAGPPDGWVPVSGAIFDSTGNLYGVTALGGTLQGDPCVYDGCGTVYEISP